MLEALPEGILLNRSGYRDPKNQDDWDSASEKTVELKTSHLTLDPA